MKTLLYKEFRLASHPTTFLFPLLSAMLLIPNYPYYVVFFYTTLGIFFVCLSGRENHDIFYTMLLPVEKRSLVRARMLFAVCMEAVQLVLAVPFAVLRTHFAMPGNAAGMDANTAFFGLALGMLGVFNLVFFTRYYAASEQVGKAFAIGSIAEFVYMAAAESCTFVVPFVHSVLDTPDPQHLPAKLIVLALGAAAFALLTLLACARAEKTFARLDL